MRRGWLVLLIVAWSLCAGSPSSAAESASVVSTFGPFKLLGDGHPCLDVGIGSFDILNKGKKRSRAGRIELRIGRKMAFVGPALGVIANEEGGSFGYAGIYADLAVGKFVLTPVLGVGAYRQGNSIDLGGTIEFRESLELSYPLSDAWRAGLAFAHVSNGGLHPGNPGQQDLFLTFACGF